jgi:Rrf2 family protein
MKLSYAADYALRALAHLARQPPGRAVPSHAVAAAVGAPAAFLSKVLERLEVARVLRTRKGPRGGYRLARPAGDITLLEVVEAVDGPVRGAAPLVGTQGAGRLDARLARVCEEAAGLVRERLGRVRLSELVNG